MDLNLTDTTLLGHEALENMTSSTGNPESSDAYVTIRRIQTCVLPTICVFGLLANSLAIRTFLSGNMRKSSCSIYLAAKCVSDNGFLLATVIIWSHGFSIPLFNLQGVCQLTVFLTYFCSFMSVWLMAIITCENYIRIAHSFWVNSCCTPSRAYIVLAVLIGIGVLLNMFHLWTTTVEYDQPLPPYPPPPPQQQSPEQSSSSPPSSTSSLQSNRKTNYYSLQNNTIITTTNTTKNNSDGTPITKSYFPFLTRHHNPNNNIGGHHHYQQHSNLSSRSSSSSLVVNHPDNNDTITYTNNNNFNNNNNYYYHYYTNLFHSNTSSSSSVNSNSTILFYGDNGTVSQKIDVSRGVCRSLFVYRDLLITMTYVDTVLTLLLPSIFMFVLVVTILKNVISSIRRRKRLRAGTQRAHGIRRTVTPQAKMTKFLLAVSLIFLVLHTPSHVIRIKMTVAFYVFEIHPTVTDHIIHRLFELLYNLNFCNNCIVFLMFGENFRQSFYVIFCQRFKHYKKQRVLSQYDRHEYMQSEMTELVANPAT